MYIKNIRTFLSKRLQVAVAEIAEEMSETMIKLDDISLQKTSPISDQYHNPVGNDNRREDKQGTFLQGAWYISPGDHVTKVIAIQ